MGSQGGIWAVMKASERSGSHLAGEQGLLGGGGAVSSIRIEDFCRKDADVWKPRDREWDVKRYRAL